jgi:hypothetical protein
MMFHNNMAEMEKYNISNSMKKLNRFHVEQFVQHLHIQQLSS